MKYTNYHLRIFEALESGAWRSSNEVAGLIATPLSNLKSAFDRLVSDGVIEKSVSRHPAQYRRSPELKGAAVEATAVLLREIAKERVPPDLRTRRDDPTWRAAAARSVGYCGLILPNENQFHGFFLMPEVAALAERQIEATRAALHDADDQTLAQQFAAAFASLASGDFGRDPSIQTKLGPPLAAIGFLIKNNYFFIIATRRESGFETKIKPVSVNEITMAKVVMQRTPAEYMAGLMDKMPEVTAIKQRRAIIQSQN